MSLFQCGFAKLLAECRGAARLGYSQIKVLECSRSPLRTKKQPFLTLYSAISHFPRKHQLAGSSLFCTSYRWMSTQNVAQPSMVNHSAPTAEKGESVVNTHEAQWHSSGSSTEASKIPGGWAFVFRRRWQYSAPFRTSSLCDYLCTRGKTHAVSVAHIYKHYARDITVTLIPLRHLAHPLFFSQVDSLCSQHDSVLMEGRVPLTGAPYSTLVPPREPIPANQRPIDHEDDEGWEPRAIEDFFQPFSWGVKGSPKFTVIHAADKYDYECLPWYCSLRFNAPLLGSLAREKHCLSMIPLLRESGYKSFAIPWGAGHMPIFHEMLIDNGFESAGMCSLLMFNRIDGDLSEAELMRMRTVEKRIARRATMAYVIGALMVLYVLSTYFEVEFSAAPSYRPSDL